MHRDKMNACANVVAPQRFNERCAIDTQTLQIQANNIQMVDMTAIRVHRRRLNLRQIRKGFVVETGVMLSDLYKAIQAFELMDTAPSHLAITDLVSMSVSLFLFHR